MVAGSPAGDQRDSPPGANRLRDLPERFSRWRKVYDLIARSSPSCRRRRPGRWPLRAGRELGGGCRRVRGCALQLCFISHLGGEAAMPLLGRRRQWITEGDASVSSPGGASCRPVRMIRPSRSRVGSLAVAVFTCGLRQEASHAYFPGQGAHSRRHPGHHYRCEPVRGQRGIGPEFWASTMMEGGLGPEPTWREGKSDERSRLVDRAAGRELQSRQVGVDRLRDRR